MLDRLQKKWKVSPARLILILLAFATGGSLTGYVGRYLLGLTSLSGILWVLAYLVLITLIWPLMVLLVSIPLGQFAFFRNYISRLGRKLTGRSGPKNPH
jgi:hypothetical protein